MANYPAIILTSPVYADEVDVVSASIANTCNNEIIALQTYIGTNPHGSRSTFADRVNVCIGSYGGINGSDAFPADTTPRKLFYRNDSETLYIRRSDNTAWQSIGGSVTNVVFAGSREQTINVGTSFGFISSTNTLLASLASTTYAYWATQCSAAIYFTAHPVMRFTKISGISTLIFRGNLWQQAADGDTLRVKLSVGSASGTSTAQANSQVPVETTCSVDLTPLINGTTYDMIISLQKSASLGYAYLGEFVIQGQ